ncbi:MAG: UDP-N-acetylmuramate dehydrogenase [Candidatus Omnitrophica bacterium]|nr:UDP-N-acetylmuramate dehydrogenase [Candidatus Omnitrophota bacterium]
MNLPEDLLIQNNVPLCRYSTFQIGGPARYFVQPTNREQLLAILEFQKLEGIPSVIIGRGSNVLFPDEGYPGLVISLQKFESDHVYFDSDGTLKASAGVSLFRLSAICQEKGASGLEFTCHIPGTVGGAVRMNAGFGRPGRPYLEIKDVLEWVTAIGPDQKLHRLTCDNIVFGYRTSNLQDYLILDATFRTKPSESAKVREEVRANFAYRNSVQDLRYPSAGSVFKNPKMASRFSSGQLIEKVGLKGTRIGGAMISEKHGNFFLNVGGAKASDVFALIELAKARVRDQFGIELDPEIKIISPSIQMLEAGVLS